MKDCSPTQDGLLTLKLFAMLLDALNKAQLNLEPVFVPLFPKLIHSLLQHTTDSEVDFLTF